MWKIYIRSKARKIIIITHKRFSNSFSNIKQIREKSTQTLLLRIHQNILKYIRSSLNSKFGVALLRYPDGHICKNEDDVPKLLVDTFTNVYTNELTTFTIPNVLLKQYSTV